MDLFESPDIREVLTFIKNTRFVVMCSFYNYFHVAVA